jgi:hypothetical protein
MALAALLVTACSTAPPDAEPPPAAQNSLDNTNEEQGDPDLQPTTDYSELEIITLLPKDAIPAIDDPNYLTVTEAEREYAPDEFIIGIVFNGEARAYSISHLSRHEIVNDTVGGVPLAVTW